MTPRLSATLIVRNEARFLDGCLVSLRDVADELIVVDTGSTDNTRDIAFAHGASVSDFVWCDDFSAARNFAIDQARGDWLLYIDADERVRPCDVVKLKRTLGAEHAIAATVQFHARTGLTAYREYRLFQRRPEIRFVGAMHETMRPGIQTLLSADPRARIVNSDLVIDHLGYDGDQSHKLDRDLQLLLKQIKQSPERVYLWWHLGSVLLRLGEAKEALRIWRAGADLAQQKGGELAEDALCFIALATYSLEREEDASAPITAGLELRPENLLLQWLQARSWLQQGRYDDAAATFARLGKLDPATTVEEIGYDRTILGAGALADLGYVELSRGCFDAAESAYHRAIQMEPDNRAHRAKLAAAQMRRRRAQPPSL